MFNKKHEKFLDLNKDAENKNQAFERYLDFYEGWLAIEKMVFYILYLDQKGKVMQ